MSREGAREQQASSGSAERSSAPGPRVVLLGAGPFEHRLRAAAGAEVVAVDHPLDAIGETRAGRDEPRKRTVVVVADPAEAASGDLAKLVQAIRAVDPAARIVGALDADAVERGVGADVQRLFDARLRPDATDEEIARTVRDGTPGSVRRPVVVEPLPDDRLTHEEEPDEPFGSTGTPAGLHAAPPAGKDDLDGLPEGGLLPRPSRTPAHDEGVSHAAEPADERSGPGDAALVAAIAAGKSVTRRGMELIRARLRSPDISFVPAGTARSVGPGPRAEVSAGGTRFGWLTIEPGETRGISGRITAEALGEHAAWLGAWLRLEASHKDLRRAAYTDPLTGAWNRRYFETYLQTAIERARNERLTLTVLVFDIDGFKQYNDRFGHPAGDEILIETVRALKSVIRPSDRVCRIGGDEFAVVFWEPEGPREAGSRPPEDVFVLATRVQEQIRRRRFPKLGAEAAGRLTISGGLATYPWDGADVETLLGRADELAIQSKRQGKNAITLGPGTERVRRERNGEHEH